MTTAHDLAKLNATTDGTEAWERLAYEHGYTVNSAGIIQNPGRFESEHVSALYWDDAAMNGDGTHEEEYVEFTITPDDRVNCPGIPPDAKTARLTHHDSGFITLSYHQ